MCRDSRHSPTLSRGTLFCWKWELGGDVFLAVSFSFRVASLGYLKFIIFTALRVAGLYVIGDVVSSAVTVLYFGGHIAHFKILTL